MESVKLSAELVLVSFYENVRLPSEIFQYYLSNMSEYPEHLLTFHEDDKNTDISPPQRNTVLLDPFVHKILYLL